MKCLFKHTWFIQKSIHDPMDNPGTYSNYKNAIFIMECVYCPVQKTHIRPELVPENSQEFQNRSARLQGNGAQYPIT